MRALKKGDRVRTSDGDVEVVEQIDSDGTIHTTGVTVVVTRHPYMSVRERHELRALPRPKPSQSQQKRKAKR